MRLGHRRLHSIHQESDATYELADLFCRQSRRRIETLFEALWHNEDTRNYKAAQRMLEGRYRWLEEDSSPEVARWTAAQNASPANTAESHA